MHTVYFYEHTMQTQAYNARGIKIDFLKQKSCIIYYWLIQLSLWFARSINNVVLLTADKPQLLIRVTEVPLKNTCSYTSIFVTPTPF